jgi:hypothetical protein
VGSIEGTIYCVGAVVVVVVVLVSDGGSGSEIDWDTQGNMEVTGEGGMERA